ncbi:MAG: hypothetical protein LUQ37_07675, partial [Methanoregulaceae archaeon]|nr:hypothetical protein [Methanoregulaceae archaeon]
MARVDVLDKLTHVRTCSSTLVLIERRIGIAAAVPLDGAAGEIHGDARGRAGHHCACSERGLRTGYGDPFVIADRHAGERYDTAVLH